MTLDLEADFSGALQDEYSLFRRPAEIRQLLDLLQEKGVKLSVFAVGKLLEMFPDVITLLESYGAEFHCHSYSHDPAATDTEEEIRLGREAHLRRFGAPPLGYRAPDGRISPEGIRNLEKHGFRFDSSIFPSYYPNPFKYLFRRASIHRVKGTDLVEIPNTPVSALRIMLSLSYIKLLGRRAYFALLRGSRLPETVVFGSHLHDFFTAKDALAGMPRFWRWVYGRNRESGLPYLRETLEFFADRGYEFVYMSEVYEGFANAALGGAAKEG
jgi:hypothetical protein